MEYNSKALSFQGYVNLGTETEIGSKNSKPATDALVIMAVGVNCHFKIPLGYFFIAGNVVIIKVTRLILSLKSNCFLQKQITTASYLVLLIQIRLTILWNKLLHVEPVACTINVYDRRFYDHKLCSSLECKLRPYDRNPS